jgi:hypothetical protein
MAPVVQALEATHPNYKGPNLLGDNPAVAVGQANAGGKSAGQAPADRRRTREMAESLAEETPGVARGVNSIFVSH